MSDKKLTDTDIRLLPNVLDRLQALRDACNSEPLHVEEFGGRFNLLTPDSNGESDIIARCETKLDAMWLATIHSMAPALIAKARRHNELQEKLRELVATWRGQADKLENRAFRRSYTERLAANMEQAYAEHKRLAADELAQLLDQPAELQAELAAARRATKPISGTLADKVSESMRTNQ